jgi:predicted DNA-binding transcriptional regulator YafY
MEEQLYCDKERVVPHSPTVPNKEESGPEVIGRILFFGEDAKLLKPAWLVKEMAKKVKLINNNYQKVE